MDQPVRLPTPTTLVGSRARIPDWLIALRTLAVAALFRPVQRRVQAAVDHRFSRRRYDAAGTIETFTARLHEEVDIETVGAELVSVVNETMRPTHRVVRDPTPTAK